MCVYKKDSDYSFSEALDSLKPNRDFIEEVILIVNGPISKNKSKKIDIETNKLNILKIELPYNIGIAKALNIGLKSAKTEWIVRFDSDDICLSDRFYNLSKIIEKNKNQYDVIGTYIEEFNKTDNYKTIRKVPLTNKEIKRKILFSNPMNHVSVLFKRSLFEESQDESFYPIIDGFEDYALWVKLISLNKKFRNFPIITVNVRADDNMLDRRGGLTYIYREIKFRIFIMSYISLIQFPINYLFGILRIFVFTSPRILKKIFYKIKRHYF